MLLFILSVTALLVFIDLILFVGLVKWYGIFLVVPLMGLVVLIKKVFSDDNIAESSVTGWKIGKALDITNPDEKKSVVVTIDENSLDLGSLFIGAPKAGKSFAVALFVQYLCRKTEPVGYSLFDGKGDLDVYQTHVAAGSKPDYFFSSELPSSDTINVMCAPSEALIDYLSRVLIKSDNPYYGPAQQAALRKVIPLLKAFKEPCNLQDLWAILTVKEAAEHLLLKAKSEEIDPDIIMNAEQYYSQDESERLKTIDGMLNVLFPFISGLLKDRVNAYEPTLDIERAVSEQKRVFYHFPLSQTALEISIMVTEIYGVLAKDRQLISPDGRKLYPIIFDDWGKFIYSQFGPITARCRSAKMPVSFTFQSAAQTDAVEMGRIFTKEITDNIGAFISLRINGMETAKWVSDQFGTYESTQVGKSEQMDSNRSSVSFVELPRVRPDSIRDMNAGEAYANVFATKDGGIIQNKRYKMRFPMIEEYEAKPSTWPEIRKGKPNSECVGLHLYRDFMDKEKIREMKKTKVINSLKEKTRDAFDQDGEVDFI